MNFRTKNNSGVVSLITVLAVGLLALSTALIAAGGAALELEKNRNAVSGEQAFYSAESAVSEGAYQYIHASSSYAGGPANLLNGVSSGTVSMATTSNPFIFKIKGSAANLVAERIVARDIELLPGGGAFKHAMFGVGTLSLGGQTTVNGGVFSNGNVSLGGSVAVNGDVFTNGNISIGGTGGPKTVNGSVFYVLNPPPNSVTISGFLEQVPSSTIPAPQIDDGIYKSMAAAAIPTAPGAVSGTLFVDIASAQNFLKNQAQAGVVYISSTQLMKVQGTNLTGTLVALGDVTLTGGGAYQYATTTQPTLIVRGSLDVGSGVTINGLVFVKGQTSFSGGDDLTGIIVSEGGINTSGGNTVITFDPDIAAAWASIPGLSTSSSPAPKVGAWSEE